MKNTEKIAEEYDNLHLLIIAKYGSNAMLVNDKIKSICQLYKIDYRDIKNVVPFLRLSILLKQLL